MKNKEGHTYLKIVRSYRDNGKVKQEVLFTLGRLDMLLSTGQLEAIVSAMSRYCAKQSLIDLAQDVSVEKVYYLGGAHVIRRLMERTGLSKALDSIESQHERLEMSWKEIITALVCSRFIEPCSKRRLGQEWLKKIYPGLLDLGEIPLTQLYRAMDYLYEHRADVETVLFHRNGDRDLFNQTLDIVFYDTTTLRFESTTVNKESLRQFGYSKENRSDCTQVVLGLLVDRDGIPVGYQLFPGNTYDGKSVPALLEKFKEKFQIGRLIFVADRGMVSEDNLESLRQAKMSFVVGMRLWAASEARQKDFFNKAAYRSIGPNLKVREMRWNQDRLVLTWSRDRAERDAQAREDTLERIRERLKNYPNPKRFVTRAAYRQYLTGLEEGNPAIDYKAVDQAKRRDGFFGILTNIPTAELSGEDVVGRYKELWKIEDAFGEMKGPLETRPMFHWSDRRIESHVLICVLAYYLEAIITRVFREKKADVTATEFFRSLNDVHAIPIQVRSSKVWIRNELPTVAAKGYQHLQIKPPDRILEIVGSPVVVT